VLSEEELIERYGNVKAADFLQQLRTVSLRKQRLIPISPEVTSKKCVTALSPDTTGSREQIQRAMQSSQWV
jgi:hypothetical protein